MVRFAVLGCGRIGRMHARNIAAHPRASLAAVYDIVEAAAAACGNELGTRPVRSPEEIWSDPAIDAVLIASSTDTHVELLTAAVKAGKAILCEKPIDLSLARVEACWAEIGPLQPRVMIGFNRRFDPSFAALKTALDADEIGEVRQVVITSRDPEVPPDSYMKVAGGLLRDMTIHDFDLARFLLGEEPVQVTGFADALIEARVRALGEHDTAMILLRTAAGRQCCITNYRKAVYGYDQRIEVVGERGMLMAGNRRATTVERWTAARTAARDPLLHFFIERYREAYLAELDAFVTAIEQRTDPPVGFADGRRALVLAEAAYEALRTGSTVTIPD
jgi:myo-inositol 2-dehydrogenase/D-chiro-inositol 1-dehydrogenase